MNETRDAFVKKMKAKLDEWNAEIAKLEAKARQHEADAQKEYYQQIDALKEKRRSTEADLAKMQTAGESAWEDLKAGVGNAAGALGNAIRSAKSRFG
jgi:uncharacterized coiled-coil DUF342 family protein